MVYFFMPHGITLNNHFSKRKNIGYKMHLFFYFLFILTRNYKTIKNEIYRRYTIIMQASKKDFTKTWLNRQSRYL